MIEYQVIEATASALASQVNAAILQGWTPVGGPYYVGISPRYELRMFGQAMTREIPEPSKPNKPGKK